MTRKFAIFTLAFLSIASGALFVSNISPAASGYETITQKNDQSGEVAEWARAWCSSPRQAIDHRCSKTVTPLTAGQ